MLNINNTTRRQLIYCLGSLQDICYPISETIFETIQRNEFIYIYRYDFSIFGGVIGVAFRIMRNCVHGRYPTILIFSEILLCVACVEILVTISRDWSFVIFSIAGPWLFDVSMMNRD